MSSGVIVNLLPLAPYPPSHGSNLRRPAGCDCDVGFSERETEGDKGLVLLSSSRKVVGFKGEADVRQIREGDIRRVLGAQLMLHQMSFYSPIEYFDLRGFARDCMNETLRTEVHTKGLNRWLCFFSHLHVKLLRPQERR